MLEKKIGRVGRDSFFYVELYHNYQIYLDFAHTSHKILLCLFGYP